jgi:hypothetical protein
MPVDLSAILTRMEQQKVYRTPGRRPLFFDPVNPAEPEEHGPEAWVREVVARYLHDIERRIGTRLKRQGRTLEAPLGCGAFGCVFRLEDEDDRVFKVTWDESEGPYTRWIQSLQQGDVRTRLGPILTVTARVDDVFRFPRRRRFYNTLQPVYGIVRERVGEGGARIPKRLAEAVNLYTNAWNEYIGADALDPSHRTPRFQSMQVARLVLSDNIRGAGKTGQRLFELLRYAWKRGVPLMDLHSQNLARRIKSGPGGAKTGQVVIFDIGGSESCSRGPSGGAVGIQAILDKMLVPAWDPSRRHARVPFVVMADYERQIAVLSIRRN